MLSKADTHIHTTASDGVMSPEETVEYIAAHTDLSVIAITDHDTAEGAFVAQSYALRQALPLEVIIGQEVWTDEGDVVGLFLTATMPSFKTAAQAIEAIHAQGGLAVAVHPFSRWATLNNMKGVGTKILDLPFDAVEVRNGFPTNIFSNPLTTWLNRTIGQNLPELGGSDSHVPFTVGQASTKFPGHTAADLRQAIANGSVQADGTLWTPTNLARLIPLLIKRGGLRQPEPVYSD
jgi:predicted metal-dependent phosphoesterase TrpH